MATSLLRRWHALRRLHWHTAVVPSTTLSLSLPSSPSLPHQTVTAAFPSVRAGGRLGGAMCTVNHRLSCRQCSTTAAGSEPSTITADDAGVSSVKGPRQIDLADRRAWDHIAASYDGSLFEYFTNEAARELVHQSELRSLESFALEDKDAGRMHPDAPAARVLDVACGTGQVTIFAARDSPSAHIIAGDGSPAMVEQVQRKLDKRDGEVFKNVHAMELDGQALPFKDDTFDLAFCNMSLMFFPEPDKGMQEMRRVLVPGGRAFISSWAKLALSPALDCLYATLEQVQQYNYNRQVKAARTFGHEHRPSPFTPVRDQDLPAFRLCDLDDVYERMVAAGFVDVAVESVLFAFHGEADDLMPMAIRNVGSSMDDDAVEFFAKKFTQNITPLVSRERVLASVIVASGAAPDE